MSLVADGLGGAWIWRNVEVPTEDSLSSGMFRYKDRDWFLSCSVNSQNLIELELCLHGVGNRSSFSDSNVSLLVFPGTDERRFARDSESLKSLYRTHTSVLEDDLQVLLLRRAISGVKRKFRGFSQHRRLTFRIEFTENNRQRHMISVRNNCRQPQTSKTFADASIQTSLTADSISCLDALSADIGRMLDAESDADLEIECDGQKIRAHRGVLCSRSPVFAKMLQSKMLEGNTGVVKVQDMEADTFRKFMNYLYTGRLDDELTHEAAVSLYEAADMYGVDRLRKRSSQLMIKNLAVGNACNLLAVADAHGDEDMKRGITLYILKEKIPQSGEHWQAFCKSHPSLANEVLNEYVKLLTDSEGPNKKRRVC